ncbi:hypothetical protein [Roseivivax isoporae]|uniref:NADH dehydrogenase subunit N n=1 Tax=Roseivivax isoporae LMG 25204 TaxID=1449351 RepID=X7FAL3_9RHOB|nr:hypothetical protein [Roseivivax isoporae]ETX29104.1 NADH dehydrogenase subunit N [Roseivivax isoporae LMG 25204]
MIRRTTRPALALALALPALPAAADLLEGPAARAALGEELRELFHAEPDLVAPALGPAPRVAADIAGALYADEIASDLARIEAEAARLFDPGLRGHGPEGTTPAIVLLRGPDCAECDAAEAELAEVALRLGVRAGVIDVGADAADRAMMDRLTLDVLPSYVMPDRMIRGHMPAMVLESYLTE